MKCGKGSKHAELIAIAHENNIKVNLEQKKFNTLRDADDVIDPLNNIIGRKIGKENKRKNNTDIAKIVMEEFCKKGLWTAVGDDENGYIIQKTAITNKQYDLAIEEINKKGEDGLNK